MGKTRNKSGSEIEHLRGIVKSLKSENNSLKRRLKQLEKKEHFFDQTESGWNEDFESETASQVKQLDICSECGKGDYKIIDLGRAVYKVCPICDNRQKI